MSANRAESGECFTRYGELKKKIACKSTTTLAKSEWRKSVPHPSFKSTVFGIHDVWKMSEQMSA